MISDLRDIRERDLDDLAAFALDLYAGGGQGLRRLHALDDAAHALAVRGHDLDIVLAVKWLKRSQGFGDFHYV